MTCLRPLSVLALLLALAACTPATNDPATTAEAPAAAGYPDEADRGREIDPALSAPAAARPMRGAYVFGHEAESFQECGQAAEWWAEGDEAQMEPLRQRALALAERSGEPYRPLYLEATGELLGKDSEAGFAANFDNVVRLSGIGNVADAIPEDCALPID